MNHRKKLLAAALAAAFLALSVPTAQAAASAPTVNCGAAVLMEKETGTILYEQNSHDKLEPASVTKVMTLLLVMEALDSGRISLEQTVTMSAHAVSMGGSQIWLKEGEQMTVRRPAEGSGRSVRQRWRRGPGRAGGRQRGGQ